MTLLKHELKRNGKALLIWSMCVGAVCFGCLLLFESLAETMKSMAGLYAGMGIFAKALGMDRLSIATMEGFYSTEIGLIFATGGAMYAAMTGAAMLSKEEEGHTGEFLYTLPLGRLAIVRWKYLAMLVLVLLFQAIGIVWETAGFALAGEMPAPREYALYHLAQLLMQAEIGSICFLISSLSRKKQTGAALGLAVLLYLADLLCRVMPSIENLKYVTPYYFSNATDIFAEGTINMPLAALSFAVTAAAGICAGMIYERRDLAA
ncbi:MAG: ABC transporter permease subunit [Lachnospiraceae bacterium]|nr:ABC transporter permease subunit [Lachnospiraceae bacterium]